MMATVEMVRPHHSPQGEVIAYTRNGRIHARSWPKHEVLSTGIAPTHLRHHPDAPSGRASMTHEYRPNHACTSDPQECAPPPTMTRGSHRKDTKHPAAGLHTQLRGAEMFRRSDLGFRIYVDK